MQLELNVPENAVVNAVLAVVGYVDGDGNMAYLIHTPGDVPQSTLIGLAELAKHQLMHDESA